MPDDPFWGNLFRLRNREEDELYDVLSQVPIFKDLSRRDFSRILGILHRRNFAAGEAVVREGDVGVGMYVILDGTVDIVQTGEDSSEIKLASFSAGDFFGDQVLVDESPRTASAITREPTQAIGFFRPDLLELIDRNPRLGLKIVMRLSQMISVRLRHTNRLLKQARDQAKEAALEQRETELSQDSDESVPTPGTAKRLVDGVKSGEH